MKPRRCKPNVLLVQARFSLGLSQSDLANNLAVSRQEVWRWENGVAHPHPRSHQRLCTLLRKTAQELGLDDRPNSFPDPSVAQNSPEVAFLAHLEKYQTDPRYQFEYQSFIQKCQRLYPRHQHLASFAEWFLAAYPEHIMPTINENDDRLDQPA